DGPVIQEAYTAALSRGLKLKEVLKTVRESRSSVSIPLVSMVSYSIVFRYGPERYFADAKEAGFDGLILPDLPPPEAEGICEKVRKAGLDTILLVAPTTSRERRKEIARLCTGFIYYLSVSGITGERQKLPEDLAEQLRQLKEMSGTRVCGAVGSSGWGGVGALSVEAKAKHMEEAAAGGGAGSGREDGGPSDEQLVTKCMAGDRRSFDELIKRYQRQAVAVSYRLLGNSQDALEVTQDAFLKAYSSIKTLQKPGAFGGWLMRIVSNLSLNYRRSGKIRSQFALGDCLWSIDALATA